MKMRCVLAVSLICVASLCTFAVEKSVVAQRFDKVYAQVGVNGSLDSNMVSGFDACLDSLRTADGIVLDLRGLTPPAERDTVQGKYLSTILGRLISRGMELQPSGISARGEWQYSDPVVILCDSAWSTEPLTTAFTDSRDHSERILSGNENEARERLGFLVRSAELMQQDRMQRMFEPISPQPTQR